MTTNLEYIEAEIRKREAAGRKPHWLQMDRKTLEKLINDLHDRGVNTYYGVEILGIRAMQNDRIPPNKVKFSYREGEK